MEDYFKRQTTKNPIYKCASQKHAITPARHRVKMSSHIIVRRAYCTLFVSYIFILAVHAIRFFSAYPAFFLLPSVTFLNSPPFCPCAIPLNHHKQKTHTQCLQKHSPETTEYEQGKRKNIWPSVLHPPHIIDLSSPQQPAA